MKTTVLLKIYLNCTINSRSKTWKNYWPTIKTTWTTLCNPPHPRNTRVLNMPRIHHPSTNRLPNWPTLTTPSTYNSTMLISITIEIITHSWRVRLSTTIMCKWNIINKSRIRHKGMGFWLIERIIHSELQLRGRMVGLSRVGSTKLLFSLNIKAMNPWIIHIPQELKIKIC